MMFGLDKVDGQHQWCTVWRMSWLGVWVKLQHHGKSCTTPQLGQGCLQPPSSTIHYWWYQYMDLQLPQCPTCGKEFYKQSSVCWHRSQPLSRCFQYQNILCSNSGNYCNERSYDIPNSLDLGMDTHIKDLEIDPHATLLAFMHFTLVILSTAC